MKIKVFFLKLLCLITFMGGIVYMCSIRPYNTLKENILYIILTIICWTICYKIIINSKEVEK
jgi:hypothetical protein